MILSNPTFTNGGGLKGFHATENLSKGWYSVEFYHEWQYWFFGSRTSSRLVESKQFGVGDVYFVAGQSNASGFYQPGIDEPTTYSSDNTNNQQTDNTIVRTLNVGEYGDTNPITKSMFWN